MVRLPGIRRRRLPPAEFAPLDEAERDRLAAGYCRLVEEELLRLAVDPDGPRDATTYGHGTHPVGRADRKRSRTRTRDPLVLTVARALTRIRLPHGGGESGPEEPVPGHELVRA